MIQEPPELVAMRLALGQQLASLREARGKVQQQIARRTGYTRSSVAKAETGRQLLTREFWTTADELLKAKGVLLASYERVRRAKEEHEANAREAALARAYAEAQARAEELRATAIPSEAHNGNVSSLPTGQELLPGLVSAVGAELAASLAGPLLYLAFLTTPSAQTMPVAWSGQLKEQLRSFLREWANTVERREHLRLLGQLATAIAASPLLNLDSGEQERVSKVVAQPSRLDAQSIEHIETILADCKRQEDRFGPYSVLYTVIAQREFVDSLLDECSDELRPRLLSLYSSMSSSIGYYFFDLGDADSAMHYKDQARKTAQEARNTELAIYALCTMSFCASRQGKAHTGIDLAAAAQSLARKTDDHLLRACVAVEFAIAYAVDGQHKECMTEFDQALTALALPASQRSPESPVYWFHEGLVASHQSECLLRLGKPAEAAASAERALQLFDSSFVSDLAFCKLRLGTARLLTGEVEEAARFIGEGVLLATKHRSPRLSSEVRTARGRLQPWKSTAAVRELDERLRGFGFGGYGF
ncbi:MAG: helix-turn-helix domain-containing protein [Pseudonocardiaceae bacterium]